ncbi:MAG: hypothetical protein ACM3X9_03310 [Bacillota bacterium]
MSQSNLVSFNIPAEDLAEIKACINTLHSKLMPYLKALSPEERQEVPKMGDKTVSFVQKTLEYCKQNPDLVPPFLDVKELTTDVEAVQLLRSLYQPLSQVTQSLWDTMTLSGSEAYSGALIFYSSARNATRSKIQKAETIYNDLAARFPGRPKKEDRETA